MKVDEKHDLTASQKQVNSTIQWFLHSLVYGESINITIIYVKLNLYERCTSLRKQVKSPFYSIVLVHFLIVLLFNYVYAISFVYM